MKGTILGLSDFTFLLSTQSKLEFSPKYSDSLISGSFRLMFKLGLVKYSFLLKIHFLVFSLLHIHSRSMDLFPLYLVPGPALDSGNIPMIE